jgi:hypothetical protein
MGTASMGLRTVETTPVESSEAANQIFENAEFNSAASGATDSGAPVENVCTSGSAGRDLRRDSAVPVRTVLFAL